MNFLTENMVKPDLWLVRGKQMSLPNREYGKARLMACKGKTDVSS